MEEKKRFIPRYEISEIQLRRFWEREKYTTVSLNGVKIRWATYMLDAFKVLRKHYFNLELYTNPHHYSDIKTKQRFFQTYIAQMVFYYLPFGGKNWEFTLGKLKVNARKKKKYEVKGEETNPWWRLCSSPEKQSVQIKTGSRRRSVNSPWRTSLRS